MRIFANLNDSKLSLSDKKNYRNSRLISCQTNTNMSIIRIHQKFSLFIHFEKEITCLCKEFFLIRLRNLNIFFIIGNKFTSFKICIIFDIITKPLEIRLIRRSTFDAGGILHGDIGEGYIFINKRNFFQLPFFIDIKHNLSFYLCEEIDISLKTHIHIFILLGWLLEMIDVMLWMVLDLLLSSIVVIFMIVEFRILLIHIDITPVFRHVSYKIFK